MIGRLTGSLLEKDPPIILIDVNGVGYEVEVPQSTLQQLPKIGEKVTLHTHFIVREDAQLLCGFINQRERELFRYLIKVNGVGPKLALGILSGVSIDEFIRSIRENDTMALTRISGIGKKTAERLLVEMRDRLADWAIPVATDGQTGPAVPGNDAINVATSALLALGYKPQEVSRWLQQVNTQGKSSETIIRDTLKLAATR